MNTFTHIRRCAFPAIAQLALIALLAACGGEPPTGPTENAPAADVTRETPAETAPAASPEGATEAEAGEKLEPVEESAGDESANEAAGPGQIVLADSKPEAASEAPREWRYSEGKYYETLTTAQGTSSSPDKIEVAEIFWYGCPHCYRFDPYLKRWKAELPDDVSFVRIPVMWNPTNEIHARIFYTAEALGKLDEMHDAIFEEIHRNNRTLTQEADIRAFFGKFGVSSEEFNNTFRSFAVESKLKRARNLTQRYRVQSVPLLVINGKFVVKGDEVKTFDDMIAVADELIERERT